LTRLDHPQFNYYFLFSTKGLFPNQIPSTTYFSFLYSINFQEIKKKCIERDHEINKKTKFKTIRIKHIISKLGGLNN
jgi:hypothetical protein